MVYLDGASETNHGAISHRNAKNSNIGELGEFLLLFFRCRGPNNESVAVKVAFLVSDRQTRNAVWPEKKDVPCLLLVSPGVLAAILLDSLTTKRGRK